MHINTNIDVEVRSVKARNILLIVFIAVLLSFTGYQFYTSFGGRSSAETSTAIYQTVYRDIPADGFVIRNETYVNNQYAGTVVPAVDNGSKVGISDTVVRVYASDTGAKTDARISDLEKDIEYYRSVSMAASGTMPADIELYKNKVFSSLIKLSDAVDAGSLGSVNLLAGNFREALTKKQIVCGAQVDVSDRLNALNAEYQSLTRNAGSFSPVSAEVSGYYVNSADGYENAADFAAVKELKYQDVEALLASAPTPAPSSVVGKLVTEFNWYLVCNVPAKEMREMSTGKTFNISFPSDSAEDLRMTLAAVNESDEYCTLIFKSNKMDASVATLRKCPVRIRIEEHEGFIIDPRAVRTVDGQTGVFVYLGNLARFRKIDIVYSDDDMILAQSPAGKEGYLKQFDEILLEGTDLYDGKIIS